MTSACNFIYKQKELFLTAHGDDLTITGPVEALSWLRKEMENKFEITTSVLGINVWLKVQSLQKYASSHLITHHQTSSLTPRAVKQNWDRVEWIALVDVE